MVRKISSITVNEQPIAIASFSGKQNYICLTDMVRAKDSNLERVNMVVQNWLRRKDTIDYIGLWERLNNPKFNDTEFDVIKNAAGHNSFVLTAKEWAARTGAIGIEARVGRYGGTYAHRDIAYHFGMWLSPEFHLLVVKELQRLEETQANPLLQQWDIKRILSKTNYALHTDAIKENILPQLSVEKKKEYIVYASEADLLNLALFGCTAKDWQESNPQLATKYNMRDTATINQLVVLSNLESANSEMIKQNMSRQERYQVLHKMAAEQISLFDQSNAEHKFRKLLPENTPSKTLTDSNEA